MMLYSMFNQALIIVCNTTETDLKPLHIDLDTVITGLTKLFTLVITFKYKLL